MKQYFLLISVLYFTVQAIAQTPTITWDNGGDKLHWSDPDNWDTGMVPQSSDTVLLTGSIGLQLGNPTTISTLLMEDGAQLTVQGGGTLTVNAFAQTGIRILNGYLLNLGDINVSGSGTSGITVRTNGELANVGNILILVSDLCEGLQNRGVISNVGTIAVQSTSGVTIRNEGFFDNQDSIVIQGLGSGLGLHNAVSNPHFGNLMNTGAILVNGSRGILSEHILNNLAGGEIRIFQQSSSSYAAFENRGVLYNVGMMVSRDAQGQGLMNDSLLLNEGNISLYDNGSDGIENRDSIYNASGATILIDTTQFSGIDNSGGVLNQGTFQIMHAGFHGLYNVSGGNFINENLLLIEAVDNTAINNVSDQVYNGPSGVINIDDAYDGYAGESPSQATNHGQITLDHITNRGVHIDGFFTQSSTGSLIGTNIGGNLLNFINQDFYMNTLTLEGIFEVSN